jgi:lysophospholipase L1-like esterase
MKFHWSILAALALAVGALTAPSNLGAAPTNAPALQTNPPTRPHDFSKWEKEIAALEAADRTNPPPRHAVMFVGSSTVRLWKTLATDFPDVPVINRGFGGSQIVDATHFADRLIFPHAPRQIFFRSGGNDLHAGKTPEQVAADFREFVATVHARLPETEIVFIGWSPSLARWAERPQEITLNRLVAEFAATRPRVKYLDAADLSLDATGQPRPELFVSDQLHFSPLGYQLLAEKVRPHLQPVPAKQ